MVACGLSIGAGPAFASLAEFAVTAEDFAEKKVYSPYADRAYPDRVYWGDTHLHTKLSPDAGLIGTTLGVEKEGYATTGTRITVRVFAGWDFKAKEVARPDFIDQGYTRGVPMGGDLSKVPSGKARLLGISKRGDAYLRSLLIHGARALIHQAQPPGGSIKPMGDEAGRTQSWECGRRGPGQQDGAYGLGDVEKHYG